MDWDEIKFCVGLTIIFSFLVYVRFCDLVVITVTLFIYNFIANVNSYVTTQEVNATTKEDVKELRFENTKENLSPSSNHEAFSGDFHTFNIFDNNSDDSSSCRAQCDEDSFPDRILQDFEQSGDFSGNQDAVNNRWSSFKGGVRKYICCCCSVEKE